MEFCNVNYVYSRRLIVSYKTKEKRITLIVFVQMHVEQMTFYTK